jgi:hypothetical protein
VAVGVGLGVGAAVSVGVDDLVRAMSGDPSGRLPAE